MRCTAANVAFSTHILDSYMKHSRLIYKAHYSQTHRTHTKTHLTMVANAEALSEAGTALWYNKAVTPTASRAFATPLAAATVSANTSTRSAYPWGGGLLVTASCSSVNRLSAYFFLRRGYRGAEGGCVQGVLGLGFRVLFSACP